MQKIKPLILWGGIDISPHWYKETPLKFTQPPNINRDRVEFMQALNAMHNKIPIIGICRGAQLLCIQGGGTLIQHSEPSKQNHIIVSKDGHHFYNNPGCHHQIMVPNPDSDYELLAWNPEETKVWTSDDTYHKERNCPEVIWFPKSRGLAIQPHPEWLTKNHDFIPWINKVISDKGIDYEF